MKPMNPQDAAFFLIEQRRQPMHVAALQIFRPPAGAGEDFVQRLYQSWRKHPQAQRPLSLRPVHPLGRWGWEVDQEFDVDYHLRHLALPRPGRIRELLVLVSQLHATLLDRNRPPWEAYLIEGLADGRFALYIKIHHGLVDGVTGVRMVSEALATSPKKLCPPFWDPPGRKPIQAARAPGAAVARATAKPLLQPLFDALQAGSEALPGLRSGLLDLLRAGTDKGAIALPFQAPPTPFNVAISGSRRFVAQSYSLERMKRIGAAADATVNDVTLALGASALRSYLLAHDALPKKPLIAMVPVSLHGQSTEGGNQVGLILASLATDVVDPWERLRKIVESTRAAKQRQTSMARLEKMAHAAMTMAPMLPGMLTGGAGKRPAFNLVISNVPGPKEALYLNGARLDEAYPVSIPADYMALNITVSGNGDKLGFGFTACRRTVPGLQRMPDYIEAAFAELEAVLAAPAKKTGRTARKRAVPSVAARN
jgi:diacylglycerol O-acyltransferase / wax synthase